MEIVLKPFKLGNQYYVYDRNTNKILAVPKQDYEVLCSNQSSTEKNAVLKKYQSKGFFLENRLTEIKHPANDFVTQFEEENVTQLILQVTQDCNLRCSYC